MSSKTKEIQDFVEKMVNEPFVSRLTKQDFKCFLTPQDNNDCITKSIYDEENSVVKIYLKKQPNTPITFHDFFIKYEIDPSIEMNKRFVDAENHRWEVFMKQKFGKEYAKKLYDNTSHHATTDKNLHQTKIENFGL